MSFPPVLLLLFLLLFAMVYRLRFMPKVSMLALAMESCNILDFGVTIRINMQMDSTLTVIYWGIYVISTV